MIKKSLEITPGIEPLYGTHDENLRLLEDKLNVTIDLRSDAIHVTGEASNVARVEQVFTDFDTLRKSRRRAGHLRASSTDHPIRFATSVTASARHPITTGENSNEG